MLKIVKAAAPCPPAMGLTMCGPAPACSNTAMPGLTFAQMVKSVPPQIHQRPALQLATRDGQAVAHV